MPTAVLSPDGAGAAADPASRAVLETLRRLDGEAPQAVWRAIEPRHRAALFRLLTVAADLPRLAGNATLENLPAGLWPELAAVGGDLLRLQRLVDQPVIPPGTEDAAVHSLAGEHDDRDLEDAADELRRRHCVTVEGLFDDARRATLDRLIGELAERKMGSWGQLEREEATDLFDLFDSALAGEAFHHLTGWTAGRDEYSLTLSLQDLDPSGIGWHRDLYWPKEWVGEDVFAVLYALGDDPPEKGGAFLYYVPWEDQLLAVQRRHHQATVLWNAAATEGRLLHAVSGYHGDDTSRHLVILQCLRRSPRGAR